MDAVVEKFRGLEPCWESVRILNEAIKRWPQLDALRAEKELIMGIIAEQEQAMDIDPVAVDLP